MKEIFRQSAISSLPITTLSLAQAEQQRWLAAIFQATSDFVLVIAPNGEVLYLNGSASKLPAAKNGELADLEIKDFYPAPAADQLINTAIPGAIRAGVWNQETELLGEEGRVIPVSQVLIAHKTADGKVEFLSIIARDISELKSAEKALQLFAKVFETTQESILITDAKKNIQQINAAFSEVTGYAEIEVIGKNPRLLQSGRHDGEFYHRLWQKLDQDGQWQGEIWNRRKNGEIYPEWLTISAIKDDQGSITNYVGIFSDITSIKAAEKHFSHLAHHDALTDLPNRILFNDRLKMVLSKAHRNDELVAVFYLDLDRFKPINDTLGHRIGDLLLQAVAERLINCVREGDTVARLGGDEFTIILENISSLTVATKVAQKILKAISQPFIIESNKISIGVSVGISLYPIDGKDVESLIRNADMAMYRCKRAGRNAFQFYS